MTPMALSLFELDFRSTFGHLHLARGLDGRNGAQTVFVASGQLDARAQLMMLVN